MPTIQDNVAAEIASGFVRVCAELDRARSRLRERDTPANRDDVAACLARADVLLDMRLETEGSRRASRPVPRPAVGTAGRAVPGGMVGSR